MDNKWFDENSENRRAAMLEYFTDEELLLIMEGLSLVKQDATERSNIQNVTGVNTHYKQKKRNTAWLADQIAKSFVPGNKHTDAGTLRVDSKDRICAAEYDMNDVRTISVYSGADLIRNECADADEDKQYFRILFTTGETATFSVDNYDMRFM